MEGKKETALVVTREPEVRRHDQMPQFRFVLKVPGVEPHLVSYVRPHPLGMEVGLHALENGSEVRPSEAHGTLALLERNGNVAYRWRLSFKGHDFLPFQLDYTSKEPVVIRLLLKDVHMAMPPEDSKEN